MRSLHLEPNMPLERGLYVLEFSLRYCGNCRAMQSRLKELEDEMGFSLVQIDIELMPLVAKSFRITVVPIVILIRDGIELGRMEGSFEKPAIRSWLLGFDVL
jgi:thioredoxin-like negative regulator of GroEL